MMLAFVSAALVYCAGESLGAGAEEEAGATAQTFTVARFADNGAALENPGMGWVFHHYDNALNAYGAPLGPAYVTNDFPGCTVAYLRLPWSVLEPRENQFRWSVLDTVIQRYAAAGKSFALCLTCFEGTPHQGTPMWVRDAGAKGSEVHADGRTAWEPDYEDPIFMAKLEQFLRAAGARYDGSPHLAFVDVGSFGIWGEMHPIARKYGMTMFRQHVDLHRRCFPRALLVINDDADRWVSEPGQMSPLEYGRSVGATFRDNSILVYEDPQVHKTADLAQPFWPDRPVILEMGHYWHIQPRPGLMEHFDRYLADVEAYHASYVSIHGPPAEIFRDHPQVVSAINRRLGYRLNLVELAWAPTVTSAGTLEVQATWSNVGVAPCLPPSYVTYWLVDADGHTLACMTDPGASLSDLPVGVPGAAQTVVQRSTLMLPYDLPAGDLELRVSVGDIDGTPRIALPLDGGDGQRRYPVGKVSVTGEYDVRAGQPAQSGEQVVLPVTWQVRNVLPGGTFAFCDVHDADATLLSVQSERAAAIVAPGSYEDEFRFTLPAGARDRDLQISVGLVHDMLFGFGNAREYGSLLPLRDSGQRRTTLGTLRQSRDGAVTFVPAS
ncbi:MAG: DUF4832 domain-containing protein [Planctomycetaceae bacterium]|nr:DUF4832 domain-containing protein [Planctomycetaceae bacterium]